MRVNVTNGTVCASGLDLRVAGPIPIEVMRLLAFIALFIAVVIAVVIMQQGQRRIPVQQATDTTQLDLAFSAPVGQLNLLIADTGVVVENDRLHRRRPFRSGTRIYLHREAYQLEPGEVIDVRMTPIPRGDGSRRTSMAATLALAAVCMWFIFAPLGSGRERREREEEELPSTASEREAVYESMLGKEPHHSNLEWFAGYASKVAAEFHKRGGRDESALESYGRAITYFEGAAEANPNAREGADIHIALALAGRARIAYEGGDDEAALEQIVEAFERAPGAAGTKDGLGLTPASTAQMLLARLERGERVDLAEKLRTSLGKLDPELLVPEEE